MERGYVKLWRKTLDSGLLENGPAWQLFGYLLLNAAHRPHRRIIGGSIFELQPGQVLFSRETAAKKLRLGVQQIRTALKNLQNLEILTINSTNKGTVISLINWHKYNDEQPAPNQQTNQCLTSGQPAPNQQTDPTNLKNKNGSIKEIKNINIYSASDPTEGDGLLTAKPAPADAGAVHTPESASDSAPQQACKPMSRKARTAAKAAESTEPFLLTKKGRKLTGKRLAAFEAFWEAYALKKGKVEAADAWLDIPSLTDGLVARICDAARQEAQARQLIEAKGGTPKWAQGWISGRRWEDYEPSKPPPARFSASEHGLTEAERQKALETMHRLELARKQKACHYQTEKTAKNREQRT